MNGAPQTTKRAEGRSQAGDLVEDHPSLFDASEHDAHVREGCVIDRFRVGALLGAGGHGLVYRAEHVELGYPVALKVLERHAVRDPRRLARFRREAMLGARLRHRNIVSILDTGELEDGSPYLVMEHVEGVDLATLLDEEGALSPAAVVDLGLQLCAATTALAQHGMLHRDIKPENVMLARAVDGAIEVKLCDFGIVKALRSSSSATLTQEGFVLGTPHYMSPEQIRGRHLDGRSDLFAIGVLLYEALTGRLPIDAESTEAVLTKMLVEDPVPIATHAPSCPAPLAAVVERALSKERDDRYRTPMSMADALREVAAKEQLAHGGAAWADVRSAFAARAMESPRPDDRVHVARVSDLGSAEVSARYLPTPAECPSALRAQRRAPRFPPPWWPAVALVVAALLGGWAALRIQDGAGLKKAARPEREPAIAAPP